MDINNSNTNIKQSPKGKNNDEPQEFVWCKLASKTLHLPKKITSLAYYTYKSVKRHYLLDEPEIHWLAVAIFAASRQKVRHNNCEEYIEYKYANVTKVLHLANLKFLDFIAKLRMWSIMASMPPDFKEEVDHLEHAYAITSFVFKKYCLIFSDMFRSPYTENNKSSIENDQTSDKCTSKRLFEFIWILYVSFKARFPNYSTDLVNSYHLLVATCDYIYFNCVNSKLHEMLNPSFSGLPKCFSDPDYTPTSLSLCVIDHLCKNHQGDRVDIRRSQMYLLKCHISEYFRTKVFIGNTNELDGILEGKRFAENYLNLNTMYNSFIAKIDFDERMILLEYIGIHTELYRTINYMNKYGVRYEQKLSKKPGPKDAFYSDQCLHSQLRSFPIKISSSLSVSQLRLLLKDSQPHPSKVLTNIMKAAGNLEILKLIKHKLSVMGKDICNHFEAVAKRNRTEHVNFASRRIEYAIRLYYRLLENILSDEQKLGTPYMKFLQQDVFHRTLFACCLEIVIYSYTNKPSYLWVFDVLKVHGFHFYKIIEIVVRCEKRLSKEVVKHFNKIEEQIFIKICWQSSSPLWKIINDSKTEIPSCASVCTPTAKQCSPVSTIRPPLKPFIETINGNFIDGVERLKYNKQVLAFNGKQCSNKLLIFFRKFYNLAYTRLISLCNCLDIKLPKYPEMIWTCFEYVIMNKIEMMRDRHLDQILICCVYMGCKLMKIDVTFREIMKIYRCQSYSVPRMYRNVLLNNGSSHDVESSEGKKGAIIEFYNTVFVPECKDFADKMTVKSESEMKTTEFSPFPNVTPKAVPARYRLTDSLQIYVRPLDPSYNFETEADPMKTIRFDFHKSPTSELKAINDAIEKNYAKKRSVDQNENVITKKRRTDFLLPRLFNLIGERFIKNNFQLIPN